MTRLRIPCLSLLLLFLVAPALADIAPDPEFGQSLAPRTGTAVAMTAEEVTIDLGPEKAVVHAVFHLTNTGPATELEVGFPEVFSPQEWSSNAPPKGVAKARLHEFAARVDGRKVGHEHRFLQKKDDPFSEAELKRAPDNADDWLWGGWYLWDMRFKEGESRTVEVDYWVPYRSPYQPDLLDQRTFTYILRTGAPWHGPIGKAVIEVRLTGGLTPAHLGEARPAGGVSTETGLRWELTDLEPTEDVVIPVRRYPDLSAAAKGYLGTARERERRKKADDAAWFRARAAKCHWGAGEYKECIAACRKVVEFERAAEPGRPRQVKLWWKEAYQPWECLIVRCLVARGETEPARRAARDAVQAMKRALAESGRSRFGGVNREETEARIARYEAFLAGEEFED